METEKGREGEQTKDGEGEVERVNEREKTKEGEVEREEENICVWDCIAVFT